MHHIRSFSLIHVLTVLPALVLSAPFSWAQFDDSAGGDWRNIRNGFTIPDEGYCDQPYIVVTKDGHWLCTLTTGKGREGEKGQHVVAAISEDQGKTWSGLIDIEPAAGPEASWVIPLAAPSGRVYAFYDYNGDRLSDRRADMLGWYVFKYSDDYGRTWSQERYRLPVRRTACDEDNGLPGGIQIFWGIDKPIIHDGCVYFAFTKLGKYMLDLGEGWVFRSDNLLRESDPKRINWEMLPEGQHGIRNPRFGSIQEEHNIVALDDGSLFCMYRTETGHPCHSYSRDGGRSWSEPEFASYAPGGRLLKHNRACPAVWKAKNGNYLFWFNNLGDKTFENRNPVWISGGIEKDGFIHWSQPEILFYDPDANIRISYPDLIEEDGRYWISQTQKSIARVSEIDPTLLEGLWNQGRDKRIAGKGLVYDSKKEKRAGGSIRMPRLPDLREGGGFSVEFWMELQSAHAGQVLFDSRDENGKGILIRTSGNKAVEAVLNDGDYSFAWQSDAHVLQEGKRCHAVIVVDGGPKIMSMIVDGVLCDGGQERVKGWERFPAGMGGLNGAVQAVVAPDLPGAVKRLRIYDRHLRTSEAISHFHAGLE
ncbi:MAG: exo-alpha-sialidase [Candidatus Omnitrophica bacterium]|nr:exo-alpha-sialidase [Candidatus Omnitrophota bacterium]